MEKLVIVIPAIKKNAVIPDQLVKKLGGITLMQRAINTAKELSNKIFIITDSEELSLIAERNKVNYYYDSKLKIDPDNIRNELGTIIINNINEKADILLYRANTPLVTKDILKDAYEKYKNLNKKYILLSTTKSLRKVFIKENDVKFIDKFPPKKIMEEIKSFQIFPMQALKSDDYMFSFYQLPYEKAVEIESYQDWWVCEKLLERKKIIFNVIGSQKIGMGHIYRSLTLAHEINDHEIIFACNKRYSFAVKQIASTDYKVISYKNEKELLSLKPDLIINDVLNTKKEYIQSIKNKNIKVLNFEDLGDGAEFADYTINELYEKPLIKGNNFLWGSDYFFLRDEFDNAKPNSFSKKVKKILITFGGTDQNNLTLLTLESILPIVKKHNININIVCGGGYLHKEKLELFVNQISEIEINVYYATEVISKIMENTDIAICSNGRTVYELADMNIPSIVISHHNRENGHSFANLEKGFVNLGVINNKTSKKIKDTFNKLVTDIDYRYLLYLNILKYSFRNNKTKIIKLINELLNY